MSKYNFSTLKPDTMAMTWHAKAYTFSAFTVGALPATGHLTSSFFSLQHLNLCFPHNWRCRTCSLSSSCLLHLMSTQRSAANSVGLRVVVEVLAGGHMTEQVMCPPISRRLVGLSAIVLSCIAWAYEQPAQARERRNRKAIPIEDYKTSSNGIKYYDVVEGKGPEAKKGSTVLVHFDCIFRGLTVVSSRESKLLAGNRVIAQPYEFIVGATPGKERKREYVENANGLFSAQAAPKPPAVLYSITEGMHVGGKRTVIVPPELGYGRKGMNEIPPGETFEMNVELLEVKSSTSPK